MVIRSKIVKSLKFYCNHCDKEGHTEDRCRYKNGTWVLNNRGTQRNRQNQHQQQQRGSRGNTRNSFSSANAMDSSKSIREVKAPAYSSNSMDPSHGLSTEQLQQIACAISMMTPKLDSGNTNAYANAAGLFTNSNTLNNSVFNTPWILDSGATDHIISDSTLFTQTRTSSISTVNLPTGSSASITSTGTVPFNSKITLDNVLCVPSFHLNLISVSKVTNNLNCCAIMFPTFCVL